MKESSRAALIASLLASHSVEVGARDIRQVTADAFLAPNTAVSIAYFPNETAAMRVEIAKMIRRSGHLPIPHIAARRLGSTSELTTFLGRLREEVGIESVFVIAGDPDQALGPYRDALALIETGLLDGIPRVGIAGYPDGHPKISNPELWNALERKINALSKRGHEAEIVTQFSFDAESVLRWLAELRARGVDAPVKLGVPGPISLVGLIYFATRSGVSASASALAKYGTSITKVIGTVGPLGFLERLADGLDPHLHGKVSLHFFTFGALRRTVHWIRANGARQPL